MMSSAFWVLPAFILMANFKVNAAEIISWQAGVQEATMANAELLAAKSSLQASAYQIKGSRSAFFPKINASVSYSDDSTNLPKYYSTTLSATENLFSGFADITKVNQAKYTNYSSEANLENVKAKISFDLKTAFMGLIYSQKYIKLTSDIIKRREANLKLVQLRFENGRENIGSLNLSKAYLSQSKYDHLVARNSLLIYQSQLAQVLGRNDYDAIEVEGSVPVQSPPDESNQRVDFKSLVKDVPDYKKAFYNEQFSKASIDLSNSAFYPSLDLSQSVGRTDRSATSLSSSNNSWVVSAAVTFPLFNGGKDYYTYKSATEDYRASVMNRKNTEETSVTNLKQAYASYVEAVMKLEVDQAFLLAAASRERIATAQYNNGLISFIDWDTIENDLIIRQKTLLQTERERVNAEATWEQAQGRGVIP